MTEQKRNKTIRKEEITFYETFDDEIVMITDEASVIPTGSNGSPRLSYAPTPVIPGFYTLTDAFENARRRIDLEEDLYGENTPRDPEAEQSHWLEWSQEMDNALVRPVTPGHFSRRPLEQTVPNRRSALKKNNPGQRGKPVNIKSSSHRKHFISAGELIDEMTDRELTSEKNYWDQQMKQEATSFDSILDETMKSLLDEADYHKVKLG